MKILLTLIAFFLVSMIVVAQSETSGSAIAIARQYVATCFHVIENAQTIKIIVDTISGSEYSAKFIAVDEQSDLVILKITDDSFPGFDIKYGCETQTADIGTNVYVLGYPLIETMGSGIKLTTGVISSST